MPSYVLKLSIFRLASFYMMSVGFEVFDQKKKAKSHKIENPTYSNIYESATFQKYNRSFVTWNKKRLGNLNKNWEMKNMEKNVVGSIKNNICRLD